MMNANFETISLYWKEFAAQQMLPPGLHGIDAYTTEPPHMDAIVQRLRAAVLSDKGGDEVSDWVYVHRKVRPRWIPKWLWRRIPTERRDWKLTVTPEWTYPNATIKIPQLGPAVRFVRRELSKGDWELS